MDRILKNVLTLCLCCCLACSTSGDGIGDPENPKATEANKGRVGDSAADLLNDPSFQQLKVELLYVDGLAPAPATVTAFENFLTARLNKPQGITIELREMASPGRAKSSVADLKELEDAIRTDYNMDTEIAVFGIFIDGDYSENTAEGSVLGVAYRNTSFAVFGETIRKFSGQPLAPSTSILETTVLQHEFGHLLGLVNAGTPLTSPHQDTAHGRHCTEEDCLMFWTAETGEGLINMISGGMVPSLDSFCLSDLTQNGGKP